MIEPARLQILDSGEDTREDARGWGAQPLLRAGVAPGAVRECHVVQVRPGTVRGNHLHPEAREWMLVCGGPAEVAWRDRGQTEVRQLRLDGGRPALLTLPPGTAHAVRCEGGEGLVLVCFLDREAFVTLRCEPPLLVAHGGAGP